MSKNIKAKVVVTLPSGFVVDKVARKEHDLRFYGNQIAKLMKSFHSEGIYEYELELIDIDTGESYFKRSGNDYN